MTKLDRRSFLKIGLLSTASFIAPILTPNKSVAKMFHGGTSPPQPVMSHWKSALAGVKGGTGNAKLLCVGDSITFGNGSNGSSSGNFPALSYPTQLTGLFNSASVNANWNSFLGNGFGAGSKDYLTSDSRITVGSGWTSLSNGGSSSTTTVGGGLFTASTGPSALSFLPTVNVDTFVVYYVGGNTGVANFGKLKLDINGGTPQIIDTNTLSGNVMAKATITGTLGSNTLNMNWSADGPVFVVGVEAYDSSRKWITIDNAGWGFSDAIHWDNGGHSYGPTGATGLPFIAPDLTLLCLGVNDWDGNEGVSVFKGHMQNIITVALASGSCAIVTPPPSQPGGTHAAPSQTVQLQYVQALYRLAYSNNIPIIDIYGAWGSWTISNGRGWMFDDVHPNGTGYAQMAQQILTGINV